MLQIGVQTKNVVMDECPREGFALLKQAGFSCADFSLNAYLTNTDLYQSNVNAFFDQSIQQLEQFFTPHRQGAKAAGITINQMHMPYPVYVPKGSKDLNQYLRNQVAPKSMELCAFFECPYIVIHGFKLANFLGSEEEEWKYTEDFLDSLAPFAKEAGITMCIENLYNGVADHLVEGPCCNVKKAVERIDRMNEKYHAEVLGFCFDTGHANIVGIDFEDFLTQLGHRLKVLHIHDNDGCSDLHQIPFTFALTRENIASTDWDGFIRGLRKIGFDKVLSFETAPVLTAFPDKMKTEALSFIAKIGKYFAEEISAISTEVGDRFSLHNIESPIIMKEKKGRRKGMDLFEQIGEALVSAGKDINQKAKDVSEIAKLKIDIRAKEDYVQKQYTALGADYYAKHMGDTECEEKEQIFLIREALEEIERMKDEVLKYQGASQCPKCGTKMPEGAAFCSRCGTKLNDMFEDE